MVFLNGIMNLVNILTNLIWWLIARQIYIYIYIYEKANELYLEKVKSFVVNGLHTTEYAGGARL